MAPDLHQSVPHSVQDMDEQRGFAATGTTVPAVSRELRRGTASSTRNTIVMDMTVNGAHKGNRRVGRTPIQGGRQERPRGQQSW